MTRKSKCCDACNKLSDELQHPLSRFSNFTGLKKMKKKKIFANCREKNDLRALKTKWQINLVNTEPTCTSCRLYAKIVSCFYMNDGLTQREIGRFKGVSIRLN